MQSALSNRIALLKTAFLITALLLALSVVAEETQTTPVTPEVSTAEITYLLSAVENSDCLFTRNGRSHEGEKAAKHLRKKYNYGLRKHEHITAEQFIEHIATKSSWTGKLYTLQCEDGEVVESSTWLTDKLNGYRSSTTQDEQKPATADEQAERGI